MEFSHVSVLLEECIENLNIREDGVYVDGTLGGAGHSSRIAEKLTTGRLYGIDRDEDAIAAAKKRLEPFGDRVRIIKGNYRNLKDALRAEGAPKADGILLDLGVSSHQLDEGDRGFSYMKDAPLDMRMDRSEEVSAYRVVNAYSKEQLARVIKDYGEEPFAKNIANHIVSRREEGPIETTFQLVEAIKAAIPMKVQKAMGHPAKRTFQAIRIEVNGELSALEQALSEIPDVLAPKGRVCIITFHSLEDRIVKNCFRQWENPCTCPGDFPVCVCGKKSLGRVITRKPILPGEEEQKENTRSQSAKLRVFERA
ncbi:MAG: 16S rRNA (cytosine(1402)-N(4))-methyltransferase RsmH [Lachnospiraceae bacterium]|nr:16S rRNA (cytosine(1402)-N(4))-methyltransferase RsmH [Lachnospiraceae bacterium]